MHERIDMTLKLKPQFTIRYERFCVLKKWLECKPRMGNELQSSVLFSPFYSLWEKMQMFVVMHSYETDHYC